jgi:FlaA1/EpsC-like NDP-sugar epimerase
MYAIRAGQSGETIVTGLSSMRISDLMDLFSNTYNKPIRVTGLRSGEKLAECLINEDQSRRMTEHKIGGNTYYHIRSHHLTGPSTVFLSDRYNSDHPDNLVTKDELWQLLQDACPKYRLAQYSGKNDYETTING